MAKCIGSIEKYIDDDNLNENGVSVPDRKEIGCDDDLGHPMMLIRKDYNSIYRVSLQQDNHKQSNCKELQSRISTALDMFKNYVIVKSKELYQNADITVWIEFITKITDKIESLLIGVGRLSDIHENIVQQDQINQFMSNESICIHTNMTIWFRCIEISRILYKVASSTDDNDTSIAESLARTKTSDGQLCLGPQYTTHLMEIVLLDLISASWNSFLQLVRYTDFFNANTFSCQCSYKLFVKIYKIVVLEAQSDYLVGDQSLKVLLDQTLEPRMELHLRNELTHYNLLPPNLASIQKVQSSRAYYVMWFIFSLSRITSKDGNIRPLLLQSVKRCDSLLKKSLIFYMRDFDRQNNSNKRFKRDEDGDGPPFSPHNEERFKLMLIMLINWLQNLSGDASISLPLIHFFHLNWNNLSSHYMDLEDCKQTLKNLNISEVPPFVIRLSDNSKNSRCCQEVNILELFSQLVNITIRGLNSHDVQPHLQRKLRITVDNITKYSNEGFMATILIPLSTVNVCNFSIWSEICKFMEEMMSLMCTHEPDRPKVKLLLLAVRLLFLYSPKINEESGFAERISKLILAMHKHVQPSDFQSHIAWILDSLSPPSKLFYLFPENLRQSVIDTLETARSVQQNVQELVNSV